MLAALVFASADRSVKDKGVTSGLTGVKTLIGPNKCKQVVDNVEDNQYQNGSTMMLCESRDGQMLGLTILSTHKVRRINRLRTRTGVTELLPHSASMSLSRLQHAKFSSH